VEKGVRRITFALPFGIDHVHCYLLRSSSGGWILVDTGLGSVDPEAQWRPVLDELDAPIEQIVVTHMHPDHVGGARDIQELTGAPVLQGREDYDQCVAAWGRRDTERFVA
jgi:glyoxylase-like metal-dependent hydrolase (beta-lactamase superfamily II)